MQMEYIQNNSERTPSSRFMFDQHTSLSIIENVSLNQVSSTLQKISQFQGLIHSQLKQNRDFGVIPGTPKPTLLKPGAEKILMLMGVRSEFEIVDSTRDFERGFFQYQVRCKLIKGDIVITEGLGACNTKEKKYVKMDAFTMDNTVLKMAKKRALIDATLLVASLSEVFTQDIEDLDLNGEEVSMQQKVYTENSGTISEAQAKRMFGLAKGNVELVKSVLSRYKYTSSRDVNKVDYEKICKQICSEIEDEKIVN